MFLGPTTFFAKASLLLLYLRIFSGTKRSFRFMIYGTLVFCFCLYWVNLPLELYFCMPRGGQAWSDRPVLMKCARTIIFGIVQGIINVLLDLWLMMIPFHIVWNLQMRRSKKILISAIFMTGILYETPLVLNTSALMILQWMYCQCDWSCLSYRDLPYNGRHMESRHSFFGHVGVLVPYTCPFGLWEVINMSSAEFVKLTLPSSVAQCLPLPH